MRKVSDQVIGSAIIHAESTFVTDGKATDVLAGPPENNLPKSVDNSEVFRQER
jgi:hypothetical protein